MFVCPTARSTLLGSNEALLSCVKHTRTGRMRHQLSYPSQLPPSISPLPAVALAAQGQADERPQLCRCQSTDMSHKRRLACHSVPERGGTDCGLCPPVLRCPDAELQSRGAASPPRPAGLIWRSQLWAPAPTAVPRRPELQSRGAAPPARSAVLSAAVLIRRRPPSAPAPTAAPPPG